MMRVAEIHARIGGGWRDVLVQLGVPATALKNKHGPCPACGGKDRFRFDNKHGRGDFICGQCGAGDGFALLQRVHRWDFPTTRREVMQAAGIKNDTRVVFDAPQSSTAVEISPAVPTSRVTRILQGSCPVASCPDAVAYLESRGLWPLPEGHGLRAHASVEYWDDGKVIGRYPALIAPVRDLDAQLTTAHITYLAGGKKLETHEPRKILSPMTGRKGCAVRLLPFEDGALGIAEGIETALSAARIHGVPVWAVLNTSLMQTFEPPSTVTHLNIFVDRDVAGLLAAARLMERLQGRVTFEVCALPAQPNVKDWNDVLVAGATR